MGKASELLDDLKQRLQQTNEEVQEELQSDKPELQELEDVSEYGMSFEEAINKIEEQVEEKHNQLEKAREGIETLEEQLNGSGEPGYTAGTLKQGLDTVVNNLESAKNIQENIEGLRQQAEETLRQQLNDMEEFGSAEERARSITADAEAELMQLRKDNQLEKYKQAIEEIES